MSKEKLGMMRSGWNREYAYTPMAALALTLVVWAPTTAQFPAQDMDKRSLGLGYTFAMRGQDITDAGTPSHEVLHQVTLGYAPLPYVVLQAGLGIDRFSVDPYQQTRFRGAYGFSPSFGIAGYSPFFALDLLRGTGGFNVLSLSSSDDRGYRYSALITNPFLGIIVSPTVFLDVTVGGRLHLVEGSMEGPRSGSKASFANSEIGRGYLAVTLKSPFERAFLNLDIDFSPQLDSDWNGGPREATVSVSLGAVLGWKGKSSPSAEKPIYFPAYPEMKSKQDKMAEELE